MQMGKPETDHKYRGWADFVKKNKDRITNEWTRYEIQETKRVEALFERISSLIEQGRQRVVTAVNIAEVYTKFHIGKYIVENEQQGEYRAQYGKQVLKGLSERLTEQFGDGWSYSNLRQIRQFFLVYGKLTNSVCQIP
jgi:hypothetical protein